MLKFKMHAVGGVEASETDAQGRTTTRWFADAANAEKQRAEFAADLADASNASTRAALDALKPVDLDATVPGADKA